MSESPEILGEVLRVLVVRPDRLGDVILSTPVFAAIRHRYPNAYISVSVRAEIAPLLRGLSNVDEVLVFDPKGRHRGFSGFVQLIRDFRAGRFDAIVVLQTELKIAAAAFLAGIPLRLGPMSKIHSYLFFNRGVRQRRSQVTKHESEYNLDLLAGLGICTNSGQFKTEVVVSQEVLDKAAMWLAEKVCGPGVLWIAVHPGMGGSALNWPAAHYETLVRSLVHDRGGLSCRVLMTFGPGEGELRGRYQQIFAGNSNVIFYGGADSLGLDFLAGLFSAMQVVVAPSTGPLHLAVALGKPVVSFYPPIRVQSAKRWGPLLGEALSPDVSCGQDFRCLGSACPHYLCMELIKVEDAVKCVLEKL